MEGSSWDLDFEGRDARLQAAKTQVMPVTLDAQGAARVTIANLPAVDNPSVLTAELEYADANGELLTTTGRVRLVPAEVSVGIRPEGWAASTEQMRFRVVVLDLDGKPLAGRQVSAALYGSASYSYRKRLIGGFYTYESAHENTKLPAKCEGKTNAQGLLLCEVAPGVSGEVLVRAEARDAKGQVAGATTSIWVAGKDDWWFGGTAADRMDVLPENTGVRSGPGGALPGAHAVPLGHGAGHRRARRRDAKLRHEAERPCAGGEGADRSGGLAERVRVRARAARARGREACVE